MISLVAVLRSSASFVSLTAAVLDRDHRMVGERLQQTDLLVVNGPAARRVMAIPPIASPSRNHGHGQQAAVPAFAHFPAEFGGVRRIGLEVGDPGRFSLSIALPTAPSPVSFVGKRFLSAASPDFVVAVNAARCSMSSMRRTTVAE
jgi:hypothetical protein